MRFKFYSASTLLWFLAFFLFGPSSSMDFPTSPKRSRIQETQDGRHYLSKSDERVTKALDFSFPHGYFRNLSSSMPAQDDFEGNYDVFDFKPCSLKEDMLQRMKTADGSAWLIDNTTLDNLGNDPQKLIQCTESADRVVFNMTGVQKFKQTLVVDHELEFVSKSIKTDDNYDELRLEASFTCPDNGPFLRIKSSGFSANGFVIKNCTESVGQGTIIIQSNSKVAFYNTIFRGNQRRAIFVASHANLTLKSCYFENNGNQNILGGAISAQNSIFLSIDSSHFHGNIAQRGGALHILNNAMVIIVSSIFFRNKAFQYGGSIVMCDSNNVVIINATLFGNTAYDDGGGILVENDNDLKIINTTLYGNYARYNGGGIRVYRGNKITIINTTLSRNTARYYGGGIWVYRSNNLTVLNTTLSRNTAAFGGGIHVYGKNNLTIINTTWSGNYALRGGGTRVHRGNNLTIINTTMSGNTAHEDGGGILVEDDNDLTIVNTTLFGNLASSGGAIWTDSNNTLNITTSMLFGNNASAFGGAMLFGDHNIASIVNCSLHQNAANWHGGALKFGLRCGIIVRHSLIQGNEALWGGVMHLDRGTRAEISSSYFSNNSASRGGIVYASMDCAVSFDQSKAVKNHADFGGCLYGVSLSTKVRDSSFFDNLSFGSGGCFNIDSSNAHFEKTSFTHNKAKEIGGAIYATSGTHLEIKASIVSSNLAFNGGGIAMASNSRIVCFNCTIENNLARRGGGVHIESETNQIIVAQFAKSTFQNNTASEYGGALVIKTFNSRRFECVDIVEPCSRVLLIETSFINNSAELSDSAIIATTLGHILVACENLVSYPPYDYSRFLKVEDIRKERKTSRMKQFDKSSPLCDSWKDNRLVGGTNGRMVGTFGQTINVMINSSYGPWINGSSKSEFTLHGVRNTKQFPTLIVSTTDTFGQTPAPTLFEKDALVLNSSSNILKDDLVFSFKSATCTISSLSSNFPRGNYTIEINPREEDVLEPTNLTIVIIGCGINEELTSIDSACQECRIGMYNFNGSKINGCSPCPEGANCTGNYTLPIGGYWNKSPCHARVKRCIVEEACKVQNRLEKLENLIRDLVDCNLNDTTLSNYSKIQCQEGYEGPLCGSCSESYGLSSSFECLKCGPLIKSILTLIGITCYLLLGTSGTIKGVLPLGSTQHTTEEFQTPLLEAITSTMEDTSSIQASEAIEGNNNPEQMDNSQETTSSSGAKERLEHEIEVVKSNAINTWKILLNFLQVTSTAATMNVKWTAKVLGTMEKLQVIGAATVNSISRPIDCLLSSASRGTRVIWRTLFSILVPSTVIAILGLYWGYRAIMVHEGDGSYFVKRLLLTVITTTYITYFDLTQVAVRVFSCVVVHDNTNPLSNLFTRTWIADTSIECYKGTHLILIGIGLVVLTLISIGFPLFCSFALSAKRDELATTSSWAHDTLSFLCGPFKKRYIYWECVTMIKKALLSIVIVFSYSLGNQVQGLLVLMVLGFFLYLHLVCNPYDDAFSSLNSFEGGSLLTSCTVYTLVQFLNVETLSELGRHIVSICLIFVASAFVFIMVYTTLSNVIHLLRMILESKNVYFPENAKWFTILKIWYRNRRLLSSS